MYIYRSWFITVDFFVCRLFILTSTFSCWLNMIFDVRFLTAAIVLFLTLRWLLRKLRVGNYDNKYVFITGCDTGFGNMLAKRLDKLGLHVFAGCLTKQGAMGLKKECSSRLATVMIDVSDDNSIEAARDEVESKLPTGKGDLYKVTNIVLLTSCMLFSSLVLIEQ